MWNGFSVNKSGLDLVDEMSLGVYSRDWVMSADSQGGGCRPVSKSDDRRGTRADQSRDYTGV